MAGKAEERPGAKDSGGQAVGELVDAGGAGGFTLRFDAVDRMWRVVLLFKGAEQHRFVSTRQHYDKRMAREELALICRDLKVPEADVDAKFLDELF